MPLRYPLDSLGWYNFETLVQTLLKRIIGPGVTSFGGSRDGGRDAAYEGRADFPSTGSPWTGQWVFQVKHIDTSLAGATGARSQLKRTFLAELASILERRNLRGIRSASNYVLWTNVPLTNANRRDLERILTEAGAFERFALVDGREVCEFLDLNPEVRRTYPQLLALSDLDRIVNHAVYVRSQAFLNNWQPKLATFVRTGTYDKALATLNRRHFLVLDGPPETGKSMMAAALALAEATNGFEIIDFRDPTDFFQVVNNDKRQLFVADDAVGSVAFSPVLVDSWARDLPGILRKLDESHQLIWTTRKYVLEEALSSSRLGEAIEEFPGTHEVLVEVNELSMQERAAIVYNHAKQANLSVSTRAVIREHAREIVTHRNFTPEKIRQVFEMIKHHDSRNGA